MAEPPPRGPGRPPNPPRPDARRRRAAPRAPAARTRGGLECAGVHDILSKSLGSDNAINVVHATVAALKLLQRPEEVAARRGLPIEDVAPAGMLRARRESEALAATTARQGTA